MPLNLTKEDGGERLLKKALKNYSTSAADDASPLVQIRHRPPFTQTNTHDARGWIFFNFFYNYQ
jgi:hypothetical protein